MRATTVRDWNGRELVVPNKELVTGQVINWTLSDSTYRVDLDVGIAYGSDIELAREILLRIAEEHPNVANTPRPKAIFLGFGTSTLNLQLRIFIPHMDYWPRVVTDVNAAVDKAFRQAGIVIAFPQQDVHIRSMAGPPPPGSIPANSQG
jgi:potassium efflux system protein